MKRLSFVLAVCLIGGVANAAPQATVNILPCASVTGDFFTLSQIATVTSANTTLRLALLSAIMGRSPLAGLTRPLTLGDVYLKLRQAGEDPMALAFTGSSAIVISGGTGSPVVKQPVAAALVPTVATIGTDSLGANVPTAPLPILIHHGDSVMLTYDDGTMSISATVTAVGSGAVGDTISLRRDGAEQLLQGIVQDSHTVTLVE